MPQQVYISGTEKDFAIHVNGKSHRLKCGPSTDHNGRLSSASSSGGCIPKYTVNTDSSSVIKDAVHGNILDKNVESTVRLRDAGAVAHLPKLSIPVDSPKKAIAENSPQPIASTTKIADLGSNNNATSTAKIQETSIVIGVNGNHIPSNKVAEPIAVEKGPRNFCDICNVCDTRLYKPPLYSKFSSSGVCRMVRARLHNASGWQNA